MPRLNTGVQGSPIVSTVAAKDRLNDGAQGSPVFVGAAIAPTRKTSGSAGSPILRHESPTITTTSLDGGTEGVAYSETLAATGGTAPYTWTVASGSLPSGLSLATNGTISGTPSAAGTASFTVRCTDANSQTDTQALQIVVAAGGPSLVAGALFEYDFTNVSGQTITDESGNGNHGTRGATSGSGSDDPTINSGYLTFDGSADFVLAPVGIANSAVTVQVVFRSSSLTGHHVLVGRDNAANRGFAFRTHDADLLVLEVNGALALVGTTTLVTGTWYCATAVENSGANARKIFLNRTQDAQTEGGLIPAGSSAINIGRREYSGAEEYFQGDIAYVVVYASALSSAQIQANYDAIKAYLAGKGITLP